MEPGFLPSGDVGMEIQPGPLVISKSIDRGETWIAEYIGEDISDVPYKFPVAMIVPSDNVVYILHGYNVLKYTNK
jgi:hypothetical protein